MQNHQPQIQVRALERTFGAGENAVRVLRGLDLDVQAGERVALYGPSGSGKTTLLNLIGALDRPTAGSIVFAGQHIVQLRDRQRTQLRAAHLAFIFQSYTLLPTYTALENVDLTLRVARLGYFERRRRAKAALEAVGLSAWSDHYRTNSARQRQRVAIARAPACVQADSGRRTHQRPRHPHAPPDSGAVQECCPN
jgi:putative ABC transport system ATP-binding protein